MPFKTKKLLTEFRRLDPHSQELFRGAWVALVLRILGAALTFGLSLLLARMLGPEGAGLYFLAFGVASIVGVGARLGMGDSVVRFTSSGAASEDWSSLHSLSRRVLLLGAGAAILAAGVLIVVAPWLATEVFDTPALTVALRIMLLAVLPFVLLTLLAQFLRGRKRIAQSLAVSSVLPPGLTCLGILILAPRFGASGATSAYLVATLVTLAVAAAWWRAATPGESSGEGNFPYRTLLASSLPLFWSTVSKMIIDRSPALFLGFFASASEVGILEVANRTALLVSFTLLAVNSIAGPKFAELYAADDLRGLARTGRRSAMLATATALPLVVVLITMSEQVMGLFGERFVPGAGLLVILALGQLVNAGTGSVALVLVMSGNERTLRNITVAGLVSSLALYPILIPLWGMKGAALTYATTVALNNLLALFAARRLLGTWVLPFPGRPSAVRP